MVNFRKKNTATITVAYDPIRDGIKVEFTPLAPVLLLAVAPHQLSKSKSLS